MKKHPNYILWLPSWYPTEITVSNGDFIQRHAKATSLFTKIVVLFVQKDESLASGKIRTEITEKENLITVFGFYGTTGGKGLIEKIYSFFQFRKLQNKLYREIEEMHGEPKLVHVHVAMNAGMLALKLKRKKQIPFLLTEHWSGYFRNSTPNIYHENYISSLIRKRIFKNLKLFLPVTKHLGETVNSYFKKLLFETVPNVVDTKLFYFRSIEIPVFRFIHVSSMNYQKNPEGIIEAAKALLELKYSFELHFIGNRDAQLEAICESAGLLNKAIFFQESISYSQVATEVQNSSAFILFSRIESLPCVILEALCCGLPVISSNVGGIAEVINESNGILVESENIPELVKAMQFLLENSNTFNRAVIASIAANQFSYKTVGEKYFSIYKRYITS